MAVTSGIRLQWDGQGLEFTGQGTDPANPSIKVDGNSKAAPSPVQQLLIAAASCAAADVVLILEKMKQNLRSLDVMVDGVRRDEYPRRFTSIRLEFVAGGDVDPAKLRNAVDLSVEKYCSVVSSLASDIQIDVSSRVAS